eukprot:scaffold58278_cov20-Tisochrysis_lutea.AAC.1
MQCKGTASMPANLFFSVFKLQGSLLTANVVRPCDVEVLQDIPGVLPSTNFVAYRHNTCSLSVVPYGGAVEVQLDPNMSDIITFTPMLKVRACVR